DSGSSSGNQTRDAARQAQVARSGGDPDSYGFSRNSRCSRVADHAVQSANAARDTDLLFASAVGSDTNRPGRGWTDRAVGLFVARGKMVDARVPGHTRVDKPCARVGIEAKPF